MKMHTSCLYSDLSHEMVKRIVILLAEIDLVIGECMYIHCVGYSCQLLVVYFRGRDAGKHFISGTSLPLTIGFGYIADYLVNNHIISVASVWHQC